MPNETSNERSSNAAGPRQKPIPVRRPDIGDRTVSLVLFSGGIDSTFVLFDLLTNTDDIVLAHHVHLVNREGRYRAEAAACKRIVAWLKENCRDFFFTESLVDRRRFRAVGADAITVAFEGGIAASNFLIDTMIMPHRFLLGLNLEELNSLEERSAGSDKHAMLAAMAAATWPNKPPKYQRPTLLPKADCIRRMGPQLTALCWTCRTPVERADGEFDECNECRTCELMAKVRKDLASDNPDSRSAAHEEPVAS